MTKNYADSFESHRRLHPRLWQSDYCLLAGLVKQVKDFSKRYAQAGMMIVDMGCGAKPYRPLFPKECRYIGVDVSNNPYADVLEEIGHQVTLPADSADLILSTQVVYLIKDYDFYLAECQRILKPGGFMMLTSHGTWTHHPASGGDYYRFTRDGLKHILESNGFEVCYCAPIVGTLGTGLHLRQLVFNSWLNKLHLSFFANLMNIFVNCRIIVEDWLSPIGTSFSCPVIIACVAKAR